MAETETAPPPATTPIRGAFGPVLDAIAANAPAGPDAPADKPADKPAEKPADKKPVEKKPDAAPAQKSSVPDGVMDAPAKTEAQPPVEGEEPLPDAPEGLKNREGWDKIKSAAATAREERDAVRKELESLKEQLAGRVPQEKVAEEVATLKAQLAEYQDIVREKDIENDPEFRKTFDDKITRQQNRLMKLVEERGGNKDAFAEALTHNGKRRDAEIEEALSEASDIGKSAILAALSDLDTLRDDRAEAIASNRENYTAKKAQREREAREQSEQQAAQARKAMESILADRAKTDFLFRRGKDSEEWNAGVDATNTAVQEFFANADSGKVPFEQTVEIAAKGHAYDRLHSLFMEQYAENKALKERISAANDAEPGARSGGKPTVEAPKGFAATVMQQMNP